MKNKLLATIVTLVLLISVFGIAFNFKPAVADAMYHLDVYTDPGWLMTYAQINGTGDYTDKTVVQLTAPDPVYTTTGERWIFKNWWLNNTSHDDSRHTTVTMDGNCNMTAKYAVEYLFTVEVPCSRDWIENFTAHLWYDHDVTNATNPCKVSEWFPNNTQVHAGVSSSNWYGDTPIAFGNHTNEFARFLNWTGYGYYYIDPPTNLAWSNLITITGPTAPKMEMAMYYMLYVKSTLYQHIILESVGEGTAEWTTEQVHSGEYSVNLKVEVSADFACALVSIPSGERPLLKDITTAGFWEFAKASSSSAYRADYCLNLVSTQTAVWDWGVTGIVGTDWDMIHMDNQWYDDAKGTWLSRDVTTTTYNGWSNSHIEGAGKAENLDWFKTSARGDMYVAGVMVAIGGPGHNGYDGYIDDITFNGETYDLEMVPVTSKGGWKKECTSVTLSETSVYHAADTRYVPDYWEVDGTKVDEAGTPPCVTYVNYTGEEQDADALWNRTIIVHMDTNHTAILYYKTQYYLTFTDYVCPTGASGVSDYTGYYYEYKNYTFTAPRITNQTNCDRFRFHHWLGVEYWGWGPVGNLTDRDFTINVTKPGNFEAHYRRQLLVQVFSDPLELVAEGINLTLTGWIGDAGWFDFGATASLYAPEYFGEEKWNNGTRYQWYRWEGPFTASPNYRWANETSDTIWTCKNFTAVYTKQYAVVVSGDPAEAGEPFEGTYWKTVDMIHVICYAYPPTWTDPKGWTYYFDYWETSPYDNLGIWPDQLKLMVNTTYTAIAHYRLGTALVVNQYEFEFESAGKAYCKEFDATIMVTNVEELYATEFKLTWDSKILELVNVDTDPLKDIWPLGYFVVEDEDYTNGYDFVATALGNETEGFTGTGALVKLTFHIIYEPCVPPDAVSDLYIHRYSVKLLHKNETLIPWDNILDGKVTIKALKPVLKMYPYILDNGKTVSVDIYVINATKLHDFQFYIDYDEDQLQVVGITLWTCFLLGPYDVRSIWYDDTTGHIHLYAREEAGAPLANGTGILATITFDVIVSGTCLDTITWDKTNTYISEKCNLGIVYLYDHSVSGHPYYNFLDAWDGVMPTPIKGDVNLDGVVDIYDLRLVASYYGTTSELNDSMLNDDDKIDIYDLIIVAVNFGNEA